jgi:hypothetical protein
MGSTPIGGFCQKNLPLCLPDINYLLCFVCTLE